MSAAADGSRFDPTVFAREKLETSIAEVMQFADGQVWAVSQSSPASLLALEGGKWREVPWAGTADRMAGLQRYAAAPGHGDDLWLLASEKNERHFVVKFNRATRQFEPPVPLPFEKARSHQIKFHPAPDGSLWVTAGDPRVFRLAGGEWREMFRATDAMSFTESPPARFGWNEVELRFDQTGAAWIFTLRGTVNCVSLKGMVRVADGEARWLEKIEGLPEGAFGLAQFVNVSGREELWVHVKNQGMFRVRTDTLTAAALEFPEDTKQSPFWELFAENGALWAVTQAGWWTPLTLGDTNGALWRMNSGGVWEKKITGLDLEGAGRHPRLALNGGLWLGSNGRGLWWVPADGEPVNLDWTKGFPVGAPSGLCSGAAGTLMVTDFRHSHRMDIARALSQPSAKPSGMVALLGDDFTRAQDGTLFTANSAARVLRQWTRDGWRDIPCDAGAERPQLAADSLNRVWMLYQQSGHLTASVWNLDRQTWDAPRPYMELLAEIAAVKPDWRFLFAVRNADKHFQDRRDAVFDRRGRAAFIGDSDALWLYDGQRWNKLSPKDFSAEKPAEFNELQNHAADGDILVFLNRKYWYRLTAENQWTPLDAAEYPRHREPITVPLLGKDRGLLGGFITKDGDEWRLVDGVLHRRREGREAAWFEPGQPNPFDSGSYLERMMPDSFGRYLFFLHHRSRMVAVNRKSDEDMTKIRPEVRHLFGGVVNVVFDGLSAADDALRWRLGDGEWSAWGKPAPLMFNALVPGEYTVSYEVMSKWLETSPSAEVKFTIKYEMNQLVREATEKLFSKNWDERNAAVKTLARFPEQARAALQKIATDRQRLNDSDRWWLDAVLEQLDGR